MVSLRFVWCVLVYWSSFCRVFSGMSRVIRLVFGFMCIGCCLGGLCWLAGFFMCFGG